MASQRALLTMGLGTQATWHMGHRLHLALMHLRQKECPFPQTTIGIREESGGEKVMLHVHAKSKVGIVLPVDEKGLRHTPHPSLGSELMSLDE